MGLGKAVLRCTCSLSPHSLKSSAAPPVPGEAVAGDPPAPGSSTARGEHPSGRWEGSSYPATAGHELHKPTRRRLGLVPSVRQARGLFNTATSKAEPEFATVLRCGLPAVNLLPTPRSTVSVRRGAHSTLKMQRVILTLWLVVPPLLAAAPHRLLVPGQAEGAAGNSGTSLSGSIGGCCHFCTRRDGGGELLAAASLSARASPEQQ